MFKDKTFHCQSSKIENSGSGIEFVLDNPPYCDKLRDKIYSIILDLDKAVETFQDAGYTFGMIDKVLEDSFHYMKMQKWQKTLQHFRLSKSVVINVTVQRL